MRKKGERERERGERVFMVREIDHSLLIFFSIFFFF